MSELAHLTSAELDQELRRRGYDGRQSAVMAFTAHLDRASEAELDEARALLEQQIAMDGEEAHANVPRLRELVAVWRARFEAGEPRPDEPRRTIVIKDKGGATVRSGPVMLDLAFDVTSAKPRSELAAVEAPAPATEAASVPRGLVQEPEPLVVEDIPAEVGAGSRSPSWPSADEAQQPPHQEPAAVVQRPRRRVELTGREWRSQRFGGGSNWDRIF